VYGRTQAPEIAMAPAAAHTEFVGGRVELSEDSAAVAYLRPFEENDNLFPGFETETQRVFPRATAAVHCVTTRTSSRSERGGSPPSRPKFPL
jgi:hypothetical protein